MMVAVEEEEALEMVEEVEAICDITGGEGAFTQWVWVELTKSTETICPANTHQVHAEFI